MGESGFSGRVKGFFRNKWVRIVLVFLVLLLGWNRLRPFLRPAIPAPDKAVLSHVSNVEIIRDGWGVPHIYGKSDADAAFGLAYANAEDDWGTIQPVLAASRGRLGLLFLSMSAVANDFYYHFVSVDEQVDRVYGQFSPETRAVLEGYARGVNYYAFKHPGEVDSRLFPIKGSDIAAGFAHKIPYMVGVPGILKNLNDGKPRKVGDKLSDFYGFRTQAHAQGELDFSVPGSNAHAVAAHRSTDGVTRLNINSHQPYVGPVAWYEAHVVSEEGWNMTGGLFPGSPVILVGHNDFLGWGHTVNKPDMIDVYLLKMNPEAELEYLYEGKYRKLKVKQAPITIDTGLFDLTIKRDVYSSVHGPVFKTDHGFYALRYGGAGREALAVGQWFRMNKARNLKEWKSAMSMFALPMFNTIYADHKNIHYVYNAALPLRKPGFDYTRVLPGDVSEVVWQDTISYDKLPQVLNPASGFLQNCNTSPFRPTSGPENPSQADFSPLFGLELHENNRSLRSLELFSGSHKISRDDFLRYKWDRFYSKKSPLFLVAVNPILKNLKPANQAEQEALDILRKWDGNTEEDSAGATLAILTWQPISGIFPGHPDFLASGKAIQAFRNAVAFLVEHYGTSRVPLGKVQRLQRGDLDLPIGGGPDILNAVHSSIIDDNLVGFAGDTYVLIVDFGKGKTHSTSRHQFGNSSRPDSPHFADQALDFTKRTLKPTLRERKQLEAAGARTYRPGAEQE